MNVDAFLSHREVDPNAVNGGVAVVVDVVRATSTMVEALAHGARAILPALSVDEALELVKTLGREDTALCGERGGLKIEGFDLGNSPGEFTADRVEGKRLIMTTTNGTRSFRAAEGARKVFAASFLNVSAVARAAAGEIQEGATGLVVICAGKEGRFGLDDAVCAGALLRRFQEVWSGELFPGDGARACEALAERFTADAGFLSGTAAGRALVEVDLAQDLQDCARMDARDVVPEMKDRQIQLREPHG